MPRIRFPVVVRHSPIEFVLAGPFEGRDRVLVRTEGAGLDLVALSAQTQGSSKLRRHPNDPLSGFFPSGRNVNVVSSMSVPDLDPETDFRSSRWSFAWAGLGGAAGANFINDNLNHALPDIYEALLAGEVEDVEYAIAPVALACSQVHEKRLRTVRSMRVIAGLYVIVGVATALYYWVRL